MGFVPGFRHLCVYIWASCLNSLKLSEDLVNTDQLLQGELNYSLIAALISTVMDA